MPDFFFFQIKLSFGIYRLKPFLMKNVLFFKLFLLCLLVAFVTSCNIKGKPEELLKVKNEQKQIAEEDIKSAARSSARLQTFLEDDSEFKPIIPKILGKDISWYLEHDSINEVALQYYIGKKEASPDNDFFSIFSSLAQTSQLNPFYIHLLNKAVVNADGVLAEELGGVLVNFIEKNPNDFTQMLLDTTYIGRMEAARDAAFLVAHQIQKEQADKETEEKLVIRSMLACAECSGDQKAALKYFFEMLAAMKD